MILSFAIYQFIFWLNLNHVLGYNETFILNARSIIDSNEIVRLADIVMDKETNSLVVKQSLDASLNHIIDPNTLYCIGIGDHDCFNLLQLVTPLSYELIWDYEINHFSLVYNDSLINNPIDSDNPGNVILPVVRSSTKSPLGDVIKLKKVTKTYADKKKELDNVMLDKEDGDDSNNDGKYTNKKRDTGKDKSWLEKNWKRIIVGIVLYNLVALGFKKQPAEEQKTS